MVTLSLSPSMILLGVRSRWTILFSLCRYLNAKHICQIETINMKRIRQHVDFPCLIETWVKSCSFCSMCLLCILCYLDEYVPNSFFNNLLLFFFQWVEMDGQRNTFNQLHDNIQSVTYRTKQSKLKDWYSDIRLILYTFYIKTVWILLTFQECLVIFHNVWMSHLRGK